MDDIEKMRLAEIIYYRIVRTANKFLRNANLYEIHMLQDHDPSYEELAKIMRSLAQVVGDLADKLDPMMGEKAKDYVDIMERMAAAIAAGDQEELGNQLAVLEKRPGC